MVVWKETIRLGDIFHNTEMEFFDRRDAIVDRIYKTRWYRQSSKLFSELHQIVEALSEAETVDEFDEWWEQLYDVADSDRVWIDTLKHWN